LLFACLTIINSREVDLKKTIMWTLLYRLAHA